MDKLRFFGCTFDDGITKGQASDAIDECIKNFPGREKAYQDRPATEQQRSKLRGFGKRPRGSLTYGRAKELIEECESHDWQKEVEEIEKEYIIDVEDWAEFYPGLTWKRVQDAAKSLDEERPGWRNEKDDRDLMLAKVAQLNPKLAERWKKRAEPKPKSARRKAKGNSMSFVILLGIVIWILWKFISK